MGSLAAKLAAGDQAAFGELYDRCVEQLHRYLAVRLRSWQDAEDVIQETFVRLARNRQKLAGVQNVMAYVFTIARNEASRWAARRDRQTTSARDAAVLSDETCCDNHGQRETAELVTWALTQLPLAEREVIELKVYAQLTFREIADVLDSPQGTVATRYRTGLDHLQQALSKQLP